MSLYALKPQFQSLLRPVLNAIDGMLALIVVDRVRRGIAQAGGRGVR